MLLSTIRNSRRASEHIWEMSSLPNSICLNESLMGRRRDALEKGHTWHLKLSKHIYECISEREQQKEGSKKDFPWQGLTRLWSFATYSLYISFLCSIGRWRRSFGLWERWTMVSSRDRQLRNRLWTSQCPWSLHKSRRLRGLDRTDHPDCQTEVKSKEAAFNILDYSSHWSPITQKSSQA